MKCLKYIKIKVEWSNNNIPKFYTNKNWGILNLPLAKIFGVSKAKSSKYQIKDTLS